LKPRAWKYELLLLFVSAIWGFAFPAQQIGMQQGLGPMTFNALRFALGALVLVPVILWRSKRRDAAIAELSYPGILMAGGFLFAAAAAQQVGLQFTSSAHSGFITAFYILFVPLLGRLFGHRTGRSLWAGIAICLIGFYLLSVTGKFVVSRGDGLTLLCAVLWACQILTIDRIASQGDSVRIAALEFAVCAALSAVAGVGERCTWDALRAAAVPLAYAGIMSVGVAFTLQVVCQKRCPPGPAAVIMSLEAVFAAVAGYLILQQTLTARALAGCGLILLGVLIVQLAPLWREKTATGAVVPQ